MDSDIPDIVFDKDGNCNYCNDLLSTINDMRKISMSRSQSEVEKFITKVKSDGKGKPYDCVIGVAGGVDSSWVLYKAKELGLRPLAVHMDNGWNSELAQSNIEGLISKLDVDLYTHIINWREYKNLMQAFFDADVVDVELLYDNAMWAVNYNIAKKFGIKWILDGTNKATEGMRMPNGWNWFKYDAKNIKSIAKKHGISKFESYPLIGVLKYVWFSQILKIKRFSFLDLLNYNKDESLEILAEFSGYKKYPYKHYESIFTRFYQGFILPNKFGIDKRKLHLSNLVVTGQMERTDAVIELERIPYPSISELNSDKRYFIKKMEWSEQDLDDYMQRPAISHSTYLSELNLWKILVEIKNRI